MDLAELQIKNVENPLRFLKAIDLERNNHIGLIAEGEALRIFEVPSATKKGVIYHVRLGSLGSSCTCPDYIHRGVKCKHILACEIRSGEGVTTDPDKVGRSFVGPFRRGHGPGLRKHPRHEDEEPEAPDRRGALKGGEVRA